MQYIHGRRKCANDFFHKSNVFMESLVIPPVEIIAIEVLIRKEIWLYCCLYCPHSKYKNVCCDTIDALNDATRPCRAANAFFIGDLNINLLCKNECKCLKDVMDIHGLCNLIESPTCFKSDNPSLIDVALTSHRRRIANTLNMNTGISDFHNLIAYSTKMHVPRNESRLIC